MSGERPVRRVSLWIVCAALAPTLLVLGLEIVRELGYALPPVDLAVVAFLWAITTLPLILLAIGLARQAPPGAGSVEDVKAAMEAVSRAERVAVANAQSVARIEQLLAQQAAGAPGSGGGAAAATAVPAIARVSRGRLAMAAVVVLAILVTGGFAYTIARVATTPDEVHIHPTFAVYVDGERIDFTSPLFDLAARGVLSAHLHAPDGATMHVEGQPGQTLGEFFRDALAANLTDTRLQLDNLVHEGRILNDGKGGDLRLHVAGRDEPWREVVDVDGYVPRDGDRILLTFGKPTPEDLEAQKASLPAR